MKTLKIISLIWVLVVITGGTVAFVILQTPKVPKVINKAEQEYDIVAVTKEASPKAFYINKLIYQDGKEYTKAFFYNGDWQKFNQNEATADVSQDITSLVKTSRNIRASAHNNKYSIDISAKDISLNMSIRNQEDYHKYAGRSEGTITINNTSYNCYIALLSGSDYAPKELNLEALGIKTNWLIFFDNSGNLYHVDITQVKNPSASYNAHTFISEIQNDNKTIKYLSNNNLEVVNLGKTFDYWESDTRAKGSFVTDNAGGYGIELNLNTGF